MRRASDLTIGFALVIAIGCGVSNAAAQTDKYPRMAAIGQYLNSRSAATSEFARFHQRFIVGHIWRQDPKMTRRIQI